MINQETPLFSKVYRLALKLYEANKKMPKRDRYLLGQRLENNCLEILEKITLAANSSTYEKLPYLKYAHAKLELLKVQLRMANEMNLLSPKNYLEYEGDL